MATLFNIDQYHQPEESYKCDWDRVKYDPAWEKPDNIPNLKNEVSAVVEPSAVVEVLEEGEKISSDRWNPAHFREPPRKVDANGNPTIFWDESIEPPLPNDFKSSQEYEKAWQQWEENSDSLTYVVESVQVSPSVESSPGKLSYADYAKSTPGVKKYCSNDSLVSQSTTTLENSQESQESISSPHHHHVNPSPLKENASVEPINETAYPPHCNLSEQSSLNTFAWKTSPDCYQHPNILEKNPAHILNRCSGSFMSVGTMHNGVLSELNLNLEPSGLVKDSYSLPRPGALSCSGNGRPPGTTFSVAKAKKLGLIGKNEVYNPEWLEQEFGLPIGWTDPQEHRAATELLERVEQHSEIVSTQGLVKSSGGEYFTSTHSSKKSKKKSSDCWYTPLHIVELVIKVLEEITLDPCADDGKHLEAGKHYTAADDGLARDWEGRVFMNPPYSCPGAWMKKLQTEFESGRVTEAIALVPAATDTNWLSPILKTQPICFWKGRIKFLGEDYQPKNAARQSHVLVYWGENWERFKEVFEPHGFVSVPSQFLEDKLIEKISSRKMDEQPKFLEDKLAETISSRKMDRQSKFLEDKSEDKISSGKNKQPKFLEDKSGDEISSLEADEDEKFLEDKLSENISKRKSEKLQFLEDKSDEDISSRKTRRSKGDGSGCIYYRIVTKKGKEYREAYYQYEVWDKGDRLVKSSKYISKRLLSQVQRLESEKAPVKEILKFLGIVV